MRTPYVRYPWGPEGVQSPGSGVTIDCELFDVGAGGLNLGSLKEKQVLLVTKPSLQP